MKALTVKQPWASLIVDGIKDIENRTWPTKFRGRVLIHAGMDIDRNAVDKILLFDDFLANQVLDKVNDKEYQIGAIIGSVEIVDCVQNHPSIWAEQGVYNYVLANPIEFPQPIPAKGKLSFWNYPYIIAEPEWRDCEPFCHCQLPVKETIQVTGDSKFGYYCRYCGGKWYK